MQFFKGKYLIKYFSLKNNHLKTFSNGHYKASCQRKKHRSTKLDKESVY